MKSKIRCYQCKWFNYDFFDRKYEPNHSFCGIHGRTHVDPNGEQLNLLGADKIGCAFEPIETQLFIFDL